jgi:5,10-methylenetetrahydrofolate reductase
LSTWRPPSSFSSVAITLSTSRIEVAAHIAALDRRLGRIDSAIEEATKKGRTNTALSAMEGQRKARAGLASERNEAAA